VAPRLPGRDRHTGPGALVAHEAEGDRRRTGVVDVPDGGARVRGQAGSGHVVGDPPQRRDVGDAVVAGKVGEQLAAGLEAGERDVRRCGGVRARR